MAVSNALGACIFNLCIGLGLPMFIHTLSQPDEKRKISDPETLVPPLLPSLPSSCSSSGCCRRVSSC